jgi:hypothetical protein
MENDIYIKAIDIIKDLIKKGETQNDTEWKISIDERQI